MSDVDVSDHLSEEEVYEQFLEDICSEPENWIIDEFYAALLPIIVEEWNEEDEVQKLPVEKDLQRKGSKSSAGTFYCGKVEVKFRNGNTYLGSSLGKRLDGEGKFRWSNGTYYEGTFVKNQMLGHGSFYYSNGARYTGQVSLGHRHGAGSYITDTFTYGGSFWNALFHGQGKLQASRHSFDGEFRCNKIYLGTREYDYGSFVGIFDEFGHRKCGKFLFKNNDLYQGHWYEDQFCDYGVYKWNSPDKYVNKLLAFKPMSYTGYWLDGQRHGVGMLEFDERIILCTWEFDSKNGPGVIFAANGDIFVSDKMFYKDHFMSGRKVNLFEEAQTLIDELLYYFNPRNSEIDPCKMPCKSPSQEILQTRNEIFKHQVQKLMIFTKECDSPLMPIFLPKYSLDFSESPILCFLCEIFPHVDRSKLISTEVKCLNQSLVSSLEILEAIYKKYAILNLQAPRGDVTLTRLGLWQLYRDIFHKMPKMNISNIVEEVDTMCYTFTRDSQDPREKVFFWQFLKHLLYIVMLLNKNSFIRHETLREYLPFFGYFGTMLILFLREFTSVENFTLIKTHLMIKDQPQLVITLLEQIKQHEDDPTIRSVFRFFRRFSHPECREIQRKPHLSRVTDEDFVNCAQVLFPRIVQYNTLAEISFRITPLEFVEILLHLFEMDIYKGKLEELCAEEMQEEGTVELSSESTYAKLSAKGKKTNKDNTARSKKTPKKNGNSDEPKLTKKKDKRQKIKT